MIVVSIRDIISAAPDSCVDCDIFNDDFLLEWAGIVRSTSCGWVHELPSLTCDAIYITAELISGNRIRVDITKNLWGSGKIRWEDLAPFQTACNDWDDYEILWSTESLWRLAGGCEGGLNQTPKPTCHITAWDNW